MSIISNTSQLCRWDNISWILQHKAVRLTALWDKEAKGTATAVWGYVYVCVCQVEYYVCVCVSGWIHNERQTVILEVKHCKLKNVSFLHSKALCNSSTSMCWIQESPSFSLKFHWSSPEQNKTEFGGQPIHQILQKGSHSSSFIFLRRCLLWICANFCTKPQPELPLALGSNSRSQVVFSRNR